MNALATGSVPRKGPTVFSKALVNERCRFQRSRYHVADQCGVSVSQVEAWEKGEAVPDVQTFKRLCGMFRMLASTPPNWSRGGTPTLADKAALDIQREVQKIKEPEKVPEPETFGAGLRRIRNENKMSLRELGEIFGIVGTAIANWESDRNAPTQANLAKLYETLPELKAAIDVGAVRPPVMQRPGPKTETEAEAKPQLALVKDEQPPEPKPEPEPSKLSIPAAASNYGIARAALIHARRSVEELRAKLAEAEAEAVRASIAHDEALAALDAIVEGKQ